MIKGVSYNGSARRWAIFSAVSICSILSVAFVDFVRMVWCRKVDRLFGLWFFFSLKLLVFLLLLLLLFNGNKTRNKQKRIREKSLDKIQEYKTSGALLLFALWMNRMRCFISSFSITALGWIYCLRSFYVCRFLFWHLCVYRFHVLVIAPQRSPSAYDEESKKEKKWFT